jgi:leukotriene A-4 hydrolase/aminopeptidase
MKNRTAIIAIFTICLAMVSFSCQANENAEKANSNMEKSKEKPGLAEDVHSYSNPAEIKVTNVDLDWDVLFDEKILKGRADLSFERGENAKNSPMVLDTRDLKIEKAETSKDGGKTFQETTFKLGEADKFLGSSLTVELPADADRVRISYETSPTASGLQWLSPEQTAGKKEPFMFTQAQSIHARSFIPLQDSPQVRVTYTARVRTPKGLLAVMSAENNSQSEERNGEYEFKMSKAIPSYLIAIAVGELEFKSLGKRSGVYTEPSMMEKASYELADTEKMIEATEKIYGEYAWGRYDLLVLPPSFPLGGMENPILTFATPTILAGDRSLVSLVAHELAHSWSGNLVTNATWRDFWLNEGFTTYLEGRIIEEVYGKPRSEMEATLGKSGLLEELKELDEADQILHVDLKGRDPDDGFTGVPYQKGALFLRHLEETVGREKFDEFVKGYFKKYSFQSITTKEFVDYLQKNLVDKNPGKLSTEDIEEWIYKPGLPKNAPEPKSEAFAKVENQAKSYLEGETPVKDIDTKDWTTQEWLRFLRTMPANLGTEKMSELDGAFNFTKIGNSEIAFQWLIMAIKNKYTPADGRLEEFLTNIGRRKFIKPLFEELAKTPEGKERAKTIYKTARSGYHPMTQSAVDEVLGWEEE